jgi:hypothetical protein
MLKNLNLSYNRKGSSILEVIIAMAIFSLIAVAMITMTLGGFTTLEQGGEYTEADALAAEGIEAVKAVKDRDWDLLTCTNCVAAVSGGQWVLNSASSETIGQYSRAITISDVYRDGNGDIAVSGTLDDYTKLVEVEVSWMIRESIINSIIRTAYISNWWYLAGGECLGIDTDSACFDSTNSNKDLIDLTLTNNCPDDSTIISTTPTWNSTANIENVTIDGGARWDWQCGWNCTPTSRQDSGILLDFGDNDLTIPAGATIDVDAYTWAGSMSGKAVSLLFTFDNETIAETTTFYPPDCGVATCAAYCQGLGSGYSTGSCRGNTQQCSNNGEIYESAGDSYCIDGPSADTCCCLPSGDIVAPEAITNLAASNPTATSVDLAWTAPGDDGASGTATTYDVRYSTSLITAANFGSATEATGEPTPSVAGSSESMTVSGLSIGTIYYFAIKTSDEIPNTSSISNVVNSTTLSATTIFHETFPSSDGKWNGSGDTSQDEPNWSIIQGNGDNNDVQVSNEDASASPSGGNHLTFEDCDHGFYTPESYDMAYVAIDLSSYSSITIDYYWQSDDTDNNEGLRAAYSTDSTNGIDGTWTQIAEYINPTDDVWMLESFSLPDAHAVSTFKLRFSSKSSKNGEHTYVDDVKLIGY